jgi:NitT/TauT family transport system substrate-binding protein
MRTPYVRSCSRRRFLGGLTLAGTAGLLGLHPTPVVAEPPPATTRLRLYQIPGLCIAPQYRAAELLPLEGVTEVQQNVAKPRTQPSTRRDVPRSRRSFRAQGRL